MTDLEPNIPLLRKVVEWVEAEDARPAIDSEWNQSLWFSSEIAKASELLDSYEYDKLPEYVREVRALANHCGTAYCAAGYVGQMLDDGYKTSQRVNGMHVSEFAAQALGIDLGVASSENGLFHYTNTAADIRRIAEDLTGETL